MTTLNTIIEEENTPDTEKMVVELTKKYHPKDLGEPTSILENAIREAITSRDTYWKERVRKIKEKVERVRLDVDVIKCDCGEPYKDSDLDLSVGELEQALDTLLDNLK